MIGIKQLEEKLSICIQSERWKIPKEQFNQVFGELPDGNYDLKKRKDYMMLDIISVSFPTEFSKPEAMKLLEKFLIYKMLYRPDKKEVA